MAPQECFRKSKVAFELVTLALSSSLGSRVAISEMKPESNKAFLCQILARPREKKKKSNWAGLDKKFQEAR